VLDLNNKSLFNKLPAFHLTREMNELCQPFFAATQANYFDYNRIYNDKSFLTLTSDAYWLEQFLKKNYPLGTSIEQSGKHLWDSYYFNVATYDAKVNFNPAHGITIFTKHPDYIEYIDIAAPQENNKIISFYLNNYDCIENFIADFREKSQKLITIAESRLVKLSDAAPSTSKHNLLIQKESVLLNSPELSNRERQCLEYYLAGATAKETAIILQLSHRTAEEYINNLKNKFKCKQKRDLLKIFNN